MRRRSGFTLVELLVVITILLILSTLVFAVFNGSSSDKTRSGARVAQSAFLGAKDRALHAKDFRGVRLTRDATDNSLVNGFVYLQPMPLLTYASGSVQLERIDQDQDGFAEVADIVMVHGFSSPASPAVDWDTKVQFFPNPGQIRIPSGTGQWYTFTWSTTGVYALSASNEYLRLSTPFAQQPTAPGNLFNAVTAWPTSSPYSSCDIQLGNDVLPFHQPISLPSGIVIDLNYSKQGNSTTSLYATVGGTANIDVMFSPRGGVAGYLSGLGPVHFLLRDIRDATRGINPTSLDPASATSSQNAKGDVLILTLFPQTGLVQTFEIDPTDVVNNSTGAAGADLIADNIYNFAQQGKSAGR